MYREGRRKAWRPNPVCVCEHRTTLHLKSFGPCAAPLPPFPHQKICECKKFKFKKQPSTFRAAKERLKEKHFDSGLERNVAIDLERQKMAGLITEIKSHWPVDIVINNRKICRHYVDFRVEWADGRIELIEAKGRKEPTYIIKRNLLEAIYLTENPTVQYRVIK